LVYLSEESLDHGLTKRTILLDLSLALRSQLLVLLGSRLHAPTTKLGSERVELNATFVVAKRVETRSTLGDNNLLAESTADSLRVDDARQVSDGHASMRKNEALLALNRLGVSISAIDLIKSLESIRSPDDETAAVCTRSKLEKVKTSDLAEINTRDVTESTGQAALVVVVDHKRTTTLDVTTTTPLALTSTDTTRGDDTLNIVISTDGLEALDGVLGLLDLSNRVVAKNNGDLLDVLDAVTASDHKSRDGRSSDGRHDGIATKLQVDTTVDATEGSLGRVHVTTTSHVTESSLTATVGTATSNTGDTSNSTTSTPRLSRVHETNTRVDTMSLMVVLVKVAVNDVDDITADGCAENGRKSDSLLCLLASKSVKLSHNRAVASHL